MSAFGFDKMEQKMQKLKAELPLQVGNIATRFFVDAFSKQGWTDKSFIPWQEVQRRIPGTPSYKYPKKSDLSRHGRNILIGKSGGKGGASTHLRQSVNNSLKSAKWEEILFSVPEVYAKRHNEGLDGMPQRQFIGNSATLTENIKQKIGTEMKKVFTIR